MNKNRRNIIIALIFLVVLLVEPFWGRITAAIQGEEYVTGSSIDAQETQAPQEETQGDEPDAVTGATPEGEEHVTGATPEGEENGETPE